MKPDVLLASISGGTDLMACFGGGCPVQPVYEGEIQALSLGMKTQVFDDAGQPLQGEQGELVCSAPFPSVPIGFWGDTAGTRFYGTYFARYRTSGGMATSRRSRLAADSSCTAVRIRC